MVVLIQKTTLVLILTFSLSSYAQDGYKKNCDLDDDFKSISSNTELTTMWAQKLSGIDLAHNLIKKKKTRNINIAVWDDGLDYKKIKGLSRSLLKKIKNKNHSFRIENNEGDELHGTLVANLICGVKGVSFSLNSKISIIDYLPKSIGRDGYNRLAKNAMHIQKLKPEVINISHDNRPSEWLVSDSEKFKELEKTTFIFCASGNYYPSEADSDEDSHCFQVGSIAYDAQISSFSMEGDSIDVLAPSDTMGTSYDGDSQVNFGGTSGASPIVSGIIADFISFFPENHFNNEDIKYLLENTSLKTIQVVNSLNGAGIINPYKIIYLAQKLAQKENNIRNENLYNLSKEAQEKLMSGTLLLQSQNCKKKTKGYHLIREAFYLSNNGDDTQQKSAELLQKILKEKGALKNALFFKSFNPKNSYQINELLIKNPLEQERYARFLFDTKDQGKILVFLNSNFEKLSPEGKFGVLKELAIRKIGKEYFEKSLSSNELYQGKIEMKVLSLYLLNKFYNSQ